MSDRSSDSSCEWIVLNEDEADISPGIIDQSLNLELQYDAVCHAVSDSIRSSLSGDELEWQYEQFEDYIAACKQSHVQDLDFRESDIEGNEDEDSNVEDDIVSKCASDIDEDKTFDLASISKVQCYKHSRNDRLNFILNLMLALVIASAIGLGTGHFLGWSHKCYKSATKANKAADSIHLPTAVTVQQIPKHSENTERQIMSVIPFSENLSNSVSCSNSKDASGPLHQEICSVSVNPDMISDNVNFETPVTISTDVLELKTQEEFFRNFSESNVLSLPLVSNIATDVEWNELSDIEATMKKLFGLKKAPSTNINDDPSFKDQINNIEFELLKEYYNKEKSSEKENEIYNSNLPLGDLQDNLSFPDEADIPESAFLEQFFVRQKDSNAQNNLTNQLRQDLTEVIQSLTAIALARLTDLDEKYPAPIGDSDLVIKSYNDFQNLINNRITDIDNFILSGDYKKYKKFSIKYLQKMVYSLVDSVDYLMKISFKTLIRENDRVNSYKFSNNIVKVIFNFNKKWEKNSRFWSEIVEKSKYQHLRERYSKKRNREWKKKVQFDKHNHRNYKYRRYSMKS